MLVCVCVCVFCRGIHVCRNRHGVCVCDVCVSKQASKQAYTCADRCVCVCVCGDDDEHSY